MKISFKTKNNRNAPYDIIRKEIKNGIQISPELAEEIMNRKNKKSETSDKFILRKDLLGLYIISETEEPVAITYIDLTSNQKQNVLENHFNIAELIRSSNNSTVNLNVSLSDAVIKKYGIEDLNKIKVEVEIRKEKFKYIEHYPASIGIKIILNNHPHFFRMSKKDFYKNINISIEEVAK